MPRERTPGATDTDTNANQNADPNRNAAPNPNFGKTDQSGDPNTAEIPMPGANEGPGNTEEARRQSADVLRKQEEMRPYPSQEEADAIKLGQRKAGADDTEAARRSGRNRTE